MAFALRHFTGRNLKPEDPSGSRLEYVGSLVKGKAKIHAHDLKEVLNPATWQVLRVLQLHRDEKGITHITRQGIISATARYAKLDKVEEPIALTDNQVKHALRILRQAGLVEDLGWDYIPVPFREQPAGSPVEIQEVFVRKVYGSYLKDGGDGKIYVPSRTVLWLKQRNWGGKRAKRSPGVGLENSLKTPVCKPASLLGNFQEVPPKVKSPSPALSSPSETSGSGEGWPPAAAAPKNQRSTAVGSHIITRPPEQNSPGAKPEPDLFAPSDNVNEEPCIGEALPRDLGEISGGRGSYDPRNYPLSWAPGPRWDSLGIVPHYPECISASTPRPAPLKEDEEEDQQIERMLVAYQMGVEHYFSRDLGKSRVKVATFLQARKQPKLWALLQSARQALLELQLAPEEWVGFRCKVMQDGMEKEGLSPRMSKGKFSPPAIFVIYEVAKIRKWASWCEEKNPVAAMTAYYPPAYKILVNRYSLMQAELVRLGEGISSEKIYDVVQKWFPRDSFKKLLALARQQANAYTADIQRRIRAGEWVWV